MSADFGMDLEEELFPLVGRDALHEYSQQTLLVKFITECDECLGASSDSSCFSRLDRVLPRRCRNGGTKVGAPECQVGIGMCLDRTFQDVGGRLVEVIDEDPAWRRILPGG